MIWDDKLTVMRARRNPVILDAQDRFIFFPNNKVAQVSIVRHALADRAIVRKDDESRWVSKFSQVDEDYFDRAFTFTVVRNPYDRAVSAFAYLQGIGRIDKKLNFVGFCEEVLAEQGIACDPHFDVQSEGLFSEGEIIPQFVARFERIGEDWHMIGAQIHGPSNLPKSNSSKRRRGYAGYYDDFSRDLIAELYAEDLANFGYAFEARSKS